MKTKLYKKAGYSIQKGDDGIVMAIKIEEPESEKTYEWEVVANGEVMHINDKFYLGYKIENRIVELEALEECFYKKLPEGKNVEIAFREVSK